MTIEKVIYIVGKTTAIDKKGVVPWELQGVYDNEKDAVLNCHDDWWIGPVTMNTPLPMKKLEWPGVYFPKNKEGTKP